MGLKIGLKGAVLSVFLIGFIVQFLYKLVRPIMVGLKQSCWIFRMNAF